jgi:hypothetical protein
MSFRGDVKPLRSKVHLTPGCRVGADEGIPVDYLSYRDVEAVGAADDGGTLRDVIGDCWGRYLDVEWERGVRRCLSGSADQGANSMTPKVFKPNQETRLEVCFYCPKMLLASPSRVGTFEDIV